MLRRWVFLGLCAPVLACGETQPQVEADTVSAVPLELSCEAGPEFGEVTVGEVATHALSCTATGPAESSLSVGSVSVDAPFSAEALPRLEWSGGEVLTLQIDFVPETVGRVEGGLVITYSSGGSEERVEVVLSGIGLPLPPSWDDDFVPGPCAVDASAPLLEQALTLAGLERERFAFTQADLDGSSYETSGILNDPFVLSWFKPARAAAERGGCFEGEVVGAVDAAMASAHPVASLIREGAERLDRGLASDAMPLDPARLPGDFDAALEAICALAETPCGVPWNQLTPELEEALTPILWSVVEGIEARAMMVAEHPNRDAEWWYQNGGHTLMIVLGGESPDPAEAQDRAYLLGEAGRAELYRAAAQIAYAVEDVDWSAFRDLRGVHFDLETPLGWIQVRDGGPQIYEEDAEAVLLLVDLGGNDTHYEPVGANRSGANPVSLVIDVGGADTYTYQEVSSPYNGPGLLPADADGRYAGDSNYGNLSLSEIYRQGAARNGIAMHFDLGDDDDLYRSLRGSQGYAHEGVGVLFDAGGHDTYLAEANAQGSALFGIGLAIDAGAGDDERWSYKQSQGFGFVGGYGLLYDGGGSDSYRCDHGDPDQGGYPVYYSPQMSGRGNSSFCQGAGFGMRGQSAETHLSGGLGILRDAGGDDTYEASVFAQGTGYWQGTGILSDGGGADVYDAVWYVQGAGAHYALAVFADAGDGDDRYNTTRASRHMNLGSGHDYTLGVFIEEGGNDTYSISSLAVGASNCNGIGLFVDNGGNDTYTATSDYGSGMGNVSSECLESRPNPVSIGIMIDAGGSDTYTYPDSEFPLPSEGGTWGHARNALPSEYGGGVDGDGESGVHAGSTWEVEP